jgi:Fur family ferric uptake transcriptional regulator
MNYRTRQREAVLRVLQEEEGPLSAQIILARAGLICPGIGAATVFRILRQLLETQEITKVELPGLAPLYELVQGQHRHFFVCESCHQLLPLAGCVSGLAKLLPAGSRMKRHEIIVFGECGQCLGE